MMKAETFKVEEKKRVYIFAEKGITFHNVVEVTVSESGNHRLTLEDGSLHIVSPKWYAIHIESDKGWVK